MYHLQKAGEMKKTNILRPFGFATSGWISLGMIGYLFSSDEEDTFCSQRWGRAYRAKDSGGILKVKDLR